MFQYVWYNVLVRLRKTLTPKEKELIIMLNVQRELNLVDFKAWAGGKDRLDEAIKYDMVDELQDFIIQLWGTNELTDTQLNDTLWFECDDFLAEVIEDHE